MGCGLRPEASGCRLLATDCARVVSGPEVLLARAGVVFELWTGVRARGEVMKAAIGASAIWCYDASGCAAVTVIRWMSSFATG